LTLSRRFGLPRHQDLEIVKPLDAYQRQAPAREYGGLPGKNSPIVMDQTVMTAPNACPAAAEPIMLVSQGADHKLRAQPHCLKQDG